MMHNDEQPPTANNEQRATEDDAESSDEFRSSSNESSDESRSSSECRSSDEPSDQPPSNASQEEGNDGFQVNILLSDMNLETGEVKRIQQLIDQPLERQRTLYQENVLIEQSAQLNGTGPTERPAKGTYWQWIVTRPADRLLDVLNLHALQRGSLVVTEPVSHQLNSLLALAERLAEC